MIGADVDQIYYTRILLNMSNIGRISLSGRGELVFPTSTPFIPKEIYNIMTIEHICIMDTTKNLVISNKIINLYNIKTIRVQNAPNVMITRNILRLALLGVFCYGSKITGLKIIRSCDENYKKIIIENTTIFD